MRIPELRSVLWVLWSVLLVAVIAGNLAPRPMLEHNVPYVLSLSDKAEHFLSFTGLALLPILAERSVRRAIPALTLVLLLTIVLEVCQLLVPSRTFDLSDMAANCAGALTGMFAAHFGDRLRSSNSKFSIDA